MAETKTSYASWREFYAEHPLPCLLWSVDHREGHCLVTVKEGREPVRVEEEFRKREACHDEARVELDAEKSVEGAG